MNQSDQSRQLPAALASLRLPQFRWLFAGNIAFFFVVQGQIVTRVFLAWDLTGKETALALISMTVAIPMLVASLVSGAFADRIERRTLMLAGQFVLMLNEAFILVMLLLDNLHFWHLLLTSFISGCAFPIIMPARMAIIFDIVGVKYFANAMALSNGVMNLSRVAGPAFIGVVLDFFDARAAYMVAVVLHLIAWCCVFGINATRSTQPSNKPFFTDTVEGVRYVFNSKPIRVCILFGLLAMVLAMPVQSLFVVFSDEVWKVGERGFGMMIAASGAGGMLGAMWVAWRGERSNLVRVMVVSTSLFAVLLFCFSVSPSFYFALFALVLANIFASTGQTVNSTLVMMLADEKMRGRVSGMMGISFGLTPLGSIPLAFAAEIFGVDRAVAGACIVLIILTLAFYFRSTTLRLMDRRGEKLIESAEDRNSKEM